MITAIAAFVGLKSGTVKWVLAGIAALFIISIVGGGYLYVKSLQDDLVKAREDLVTERIAADLARQSADTMRKEIERQAAAMKRMNDELAVARAEWSVKQDEINKVDTTDARKAAADLSRLSHELNRMLERSSRP